MMDKKLHGKTALVTGGAKRIGREISIALAKQGVNVVVHYFSSKRDAQVLRDELVEYGVNSRVVKADFQKTGDYSTLIERSQDIAGSLDILINNASIFLPSNISNLNLNTLCRQVQVNAWVPFTLSRDFARSIRKGKIINLLDSRITSSDRQHVAYILSKQMLSTLTKMTALEFAPHITVNGIAPALILPPAGKNERYLKQLAARTPLKQHGDPKDISDAVLYLLKSDFVTGQILNVDGGLNLMESGHGPHLYS
jgi:pteridine reductase